MKGVTYIRKILYIFLSFIAVVIVGCGSKSGIYEIPVEFEEGISGIIYYEPNSVFDVRIQNNTKQEFMLGNTSGKLYFMNDGKWVEVSPSYEKGEVVTWTKVQLVFYEGKMHSNIKVPNAYHAELEKGKYRIDFEGEITESGENKILSAEFELE